MSSLFCFVWWGLLGVLFGWVASWLLGRRRQPAVADRIVEKPVDRIVEKPVDNPAHLARIGALETEAALIPGLREEIARLRATPPVTIERIVEKPVERVVDRLFPGAVGLAERDVRLRDMQRRVDDLESELVRLRREPDLDIAAARAAGVKLKSADDLEIIEGVAPRIAELLHANGVHTFAQLASMSPSDIAPILDKAGPSFRMANPDTWPEQADLAARYQWRALLLLQQSLSGGLR